MTARAIYVPITSEDLERLRALAKRESRWPRDQAAYIIRQHLRRIDLRQARPKVAGGGEER